MCIPALVSQPLLTIEQQSKYLLRALGALRLLRSKQRIVPDEAAYRALIVACGRTTSDRRIELVKLFGLLRSDGIFPSAVTLGQYTKALAEGYSKHRASGGGVDEEAGGIDWTADNSNRGGHSQRLLQTDDTESVLSLLDGDLAVLEESGRRWRQKSPSGNDGIPKQKDSRSEVITNKGLDGNRKKGSKSWLPVLSASSLAPTRAPDARAEQSANILENTHLLAMWSRTKCCDCKYWVIEHAPGFFRLRLTHFNPSLRLHSP